MGTVLNESFDLYSTNTGINNGTGILTNWTCAYPYDSGIIAGRYAGQALRKPSAGGIEPWYRVLPAPLTTYTFGHDWRNANLGVEMVHMMCNTGTDQLTPVANSDGSVSIHLGNSGGTVLGTTAAGLLSANNWFYMEYACVIDPVAGSIEVRIEGIVVLTLTGINTQNAVGGFGAIQVPESGQTDVDNMVVQDVLNLNGPLRSDPYFPASDVSTGTFVATPGPAFYNMINENPNDQDTTYIESGTVGDVALFTPQTMTLAGSIFTICATCVARDGTGSGSEMGIEFTDGTNTIVGTTITLANGYSFTQSFFPTAPDTTGWTISNFNAVDYGPKVIATTGDTVRVTQLALEVLSTPPPLGLQVAEQANYVVYHQPGVIVSEQANYVVYHQPGVIVAEQSAYIVYLASSGRRRQYYLM